MQFAIKVLSTAYNWTNLINLPYSSATTVLVGAYTESGDAELRVWENASTLEAAGGKQSSAYYNVVFIYTAK